MYKLLSILGFICLNLCADLPKPNPEAYHYLDQLAIEAGADKGSSFHNYTEVYAQFFDPIKDLPFKFLEIGLYKGNSVKLWENYFKNAELHFADITFENVEYFSTRSFYHLADQQKEQDLLAIIHQCGGSFDVIIDDGGHTMEQQIVSFQTLFPYLSSGGLYVIEDLHTSYWPSFGGSNFSGRRGRRAPMTTVNFLQNLINDVNFVGATTTRASHLNLDPVLQSQLTLFQKEIESLHFYDSLVLIRKR